MRICGRLAALVAAAAFVVVSSAAAQEKVILERTLTQPTGWWQYHNVTPQQLSGFVDQHKARIIDLDVNDASPLRMSAALVANSGPYASGWWWYYGLTAQQVSDKLSEHRLDAVPTEGALSDRGPQGLNSTVTSRAGLFPVLVTVWV